MPRTVCPYCNGDTWQETPLPHCLIAYPQTAPVGQATAVDAYTCTGCGELRLAQPSGARRRAAERYWSRLRARTGPGKEDWQDPWRGEEQWQARRAQAIALEGSYLRLKIDSDMFQSFDHLGASVEFDERYYDLLRGAIAKHEARLVRLANLYHDENRDYNSFLYDLVAMVYFISRLPGGFERLLEKNELKSEGDLLHNRVMAQLASHFQRGGEVALNPRSKGGPSPDLTVDGISVEIKTIIGRYYWTEDFVARLLRKIREKRDAGMKQAGGGAVFVSFWSIYMNNLFRDYFFGQYRSKPYPPQKGKTYFVLDGHRAFEDYYTTGGVFQQLGALPACDMLKQSPLSSPSPYGIFAVTRAGFPISMQAPPGKFQIPFSMG